MDVRRPATLVVVADLTSLDGTPKGANVALFVNNHRIWRATADCRLILPVPVEGGSRLDFCVQSGASAEAVSVHLRLALFNVTESGDLDLIDDARAGLDETEARRWIQATGLETGQVAEWLGHAALEYLSPDRSDAGTELELCFDRPLSRLAMDLRRQQQDTARQRYVFFMTPRSGSTAMCEMMSRTGRLGHPHEYFSGDQMAFFSAVLRVPFGWPPAFDYVDALSRSCKSDNGVFGFQIEYDRFVAQGERFMDHFAGWPVVYLTRQDVLAQAISFFFASEGNRWSNFAKETREVAFDRCKLLTYVKTLLRHMKGFEAMFVARGIKPLRLYYEQDMLQYPASTLTRIARHIGIDDLAVGDCDLGALSWKVTRRAVNYEFARRAMAEGGEMFGYNLFDCGGEVAAVLAGLDPADLPRSEYWRPLAFRGPNRNSVHRAVSAALQNMNETIQAWSAAGVGTT